MNLEAHGREGLCPSLPLSLSPCCPRAFACLLCSGVCTPPHHQRFVGASVSTSVLNLLRQVFERPLPHPYLVCSLSVSHPIPSSSLSLLLLCFLPFLLFPLRNPLRSSSDLSRVLCGSLISSISRLLVVLVVGLSFSHLAATSSLGCVVSQVVHTSWAPPPIPPSPSTADSRCHDLVCACASTRTIKQLNNHLTTWRAIKFHSIGGVR